MTEKQIRNYEADSKRKKLIEVGGRGTQWDKKWYMDGGFTDLEKKPAA